MFKISVTELLDGFGKSFEKLRHTKLLGLQTEQRKTINFNLNLGKDFSKFGFKSSLRLSSNIFITLSVRL